MSLGASSLIVVIFALILKIETGMIPSFARAQDKIQLTDELSADGFRSLLADTVAFRAFPLDQNRTTRRIGAFLPLIVRQLMAG